LRRNIVLDIQNRKSKPVIIEDDVLIGTRCVILKGVRIGARSVVGAGSIVTKSIPPNEIWAGNPAKKIRSLY
jgi:acetyltransferase-like isoleucine patch superfamily enzyme